MDEKAMIQVIIFRWGSIESESSAPDGDADRTGLRLEVFHFLLFIDDSG